MRVRVLFFGLLKDLRGASAEDLVLAEGSTVADVLAGYEARFDHAVLRSLAVAVNQQYSRPEAALADGDEVALLPPVSGGSQSNVHARVELVREPIDTAAVVAGLKAASDGAVVVFDGVVRDNTRGRATRHLEYEAYEGMALEQMHRLAQTAAADFAIRDVAVMHRLGTLTVGETSVVVAVAAAHRAAAFEACRWLIDTLKREVPIWKKEVFIDGAVWAAGEPFPEGIAANGR